jgi:hypothetical protein
MAGRQRYGDFNDDDNNYNYNSNHPIRRSNSFDDDNYYVDRKRGRSSREQHKSRVGEALADLEGGSWRQEVSALTRRSRTRNRAHDQRDLYDRCRGSSTSTTSSHRSHNHDRRSRCEQATEAALIAGAIEAFRIRKKPGPWTGDKGIRVATAALGAAGVDVLIDKDPDRKATRHIVEATIGGLAVNRFANGTRNLTRS